MIKKLISGLLLCTVLISGLIQTSCMGKFALLKKLYAWNEDATGNKFLNNLLFWILLIVPVYGFVTFVDAVILNLIEFWTGSNPMAMNEGDRIEKQMSDGNGGQFLAVATKNRMEVLYAGHPEKSFALVYQPAQKAWMLETDSKTMCLARELDPTHLAVYQPDGSTFRVSKDFDPKMLTRLALSQMTAFR